METRKFTWAENGGIQTAYEVTGTGPDALLLPALSSISSRGEMHPLAQRLSQHYRCHIPDWPGFGLTPYTAGSAPRLTPELMFGFLRSFMAQVLRKPVLAVTAGHGSAYLAKLAGETPQSISHLVLIAPTWRGPLPTAMGNERRPFFAKLRSVVETPVVGPALFRLNVNDRMMRRMMKSHVYADPDFVTDEIVAAKSAVTGKPGARFATAAFVTGGLDLVRERQDFLDLFAASGMPPVLAVIGRETPPKSRAEMDALAALPQVAGALVLGALAAHEEHPGAVADAILHFAKPAMAAGVKQA